MIDINNQWIQLLIFELIFTVIAMSWAIYLIRSKKR